jgi:hypothetical protein
MKDAAEGELHLYELKSPAGTIVASPIGPHFEDSTILYVPTWMWDALKDPADDAVVCVLERCRPSMASMIALEPHTSNLLKCKDPESALRNAFERYSCIQKGCTYPLQLEDLPDPLWVTIPAVTPDRPEPLCIRNVELTVNMLPARDAPLPVPPVAAAAPAAVVLPPAAAARSVSRFAHPAGFVPFSGTGNTIGKK